MTGAAFACGGAQTLSCRQSSDIGPLAPPKLGEPSAFISCGQEGPFSVAIRGAVQAFTGCGGAQRRAPVGAAANGMPRKTLARSPASPTTGPESIFTVTVLAGWAIATLAQSA